MPNKQNIEGKNLYHWKNIYLLIYKLGLSWAKSKFSMVGIVNKVGLELEFIYCIGWAGRSKLTKTK